MSAITQQQIEILENLAECIAVASDRTVSIDIASAFCNDQVSVTIKGSGPKTRSLWSFQKAYVYLTEELDGLLAENYGIEV